MEELKEIPYYPLSMYRVTPSGKLWSVRNQIFVKTNRNKQGYEVASVSFDDKRKRRTMRVHRLVGLAFHGVPEGYPKKDINHKDGAKTNNHYTNLEWVTQTQNNLHASENGLIKSGFHIRVTDLNTSFTIDYPTLAYAQRELGLDSPHKVHDLIRLKQVHQGRYAVELIKGNSNKKKSRIGINAADFKSLNFYRTDTLLEMTFLSGISLAALRKALKRGGLINGIYFWPSNRTDWVEVVDEFTQEQIDTSVERYDRKQQAAIAGAAKKKALA